MAETNQRDQSTNHRGWTFNLALFRVVFLSAAVVPFGYETLQWTREVMPTLQPDLWRPISFYQYLPIGILTNSALAQGLAVTNLVAVGFGIIGLYTRTVLTVATCLSLYVFGLTQNLGKVDHFHHLVWFLALLAAGPSGHVLSVDAARRATRRSDRGFIEPPTLDGKALLALRYVWVMFGLLYFLPGLAKLDAALTSRWTSAENLRQIIWLKWLENAFYGPGFTYPAFVELLPPWLLSTFGWTTILFELSLIGLVWFRHARHLGALAGIAFHLGNGIILAIPFETLAIAYFGFFDWSALARRLGPLRVRYDGSCGICRRTVALLLTWDVGSVLAPISRPSDDPRPVEEEVLLHDLYTVGSSRKGYDAYRAIARRLPLLWFAVPFMSAPVIATIGRRIHRHITDSRKYRIVASCPQVFREQIGMPVTVHVVGLALVIMQTSISFSEFAGALGDRHPLPSATLRNILAAYRWRAFRWPFDLYPLFNERVDKTAEVWEARIVASDGHESRVSPAAYAKTIGHPARCLVVTRLILGLPDDTQRKLLSLAIVRSLVTHERPPGDVVEVRVYRARYQVGPIYERPVEERLLYSFPASLLRGIEGK